ncbi:MAG: hypothetical protein V1767_09440 [Chloroflexota bacterium]
MKEGFIGKRCPKCGGNIYLDRDEYGWYQKCLQCGFNCELESIVDARVRVVRSKLEKLPVEEETESPGASLD